MSCGCCCSFWSVRPALVATVPVCALHRCHTSLLFLAWPSACLCPCSSGGGCLVGLTAWSDPAILGRIRPSSQSRAPSISAACAFRPSVHRPSCLPLFVCLCGSVPVLVPRGWCLVGSDQTWSDPAEQSGLDRSLDRSLGARPAPLAALRSSSHPVPFSHPAHPVPLSTPRLDPLGLVRRACVCPGAVRCVRCRAPGAVRAGVRAALIASVGLRVLPCVVVVQPVSAR